MEEISPRLAGAKFFTKLDAKAGYWSVRLTEDAQKLTTFRTPFGRYRFRWLPFGLKVSQDIFEAMMDTFLEGLDRVLNISDDIIVVGNTEEEHDQNLALLMDKAEANGVVFNIDKCLMKQKSVTFFGNQYSNEGVWPDPEKVRDIQKMPTPQNKEELHSFIGLMQYLSQFTPNFADRAHHFRELLKQDVTWVWEPSHQKCFEELKTAVTKPICLKYYDTTKPLSLEVDASQKGLGAALVQDGKPIAFGSKTLTECQSRYSNIQREMLAVVWGIEGYHTYLYGRAFTVVSDHKPLEIICSKPLRSAPPRLQRMLTKIQGYDFKVIYRPGKDMLLADTQQTAQPWQQQGSSTWLKSRRSHRTPRWRDWTGADQLLYSETEGASRGDTERSSTAWTDVDYLQGVARLNQTTPNRPQAILVCKGWACCWIRSCVQRAKNRRSQNSSRKHPHTTSWGTSGNWEDQRLGPWKHLLAQHQRPHHQNV